MEKEVDMLCRLIEESQKEASTLLSYAGAVSSSPQKGSSKKWSPAYTPQHECTKWGPPLPPSVGYSTNGGLWRPNAMSLDVKSFLSPM